MLTQVEGMSDTLMNRAHEILKILEREFSFKPEEFMALIARRSGDPFRILVATILSQNTNDRNSKAALEGLESRFEIKPEVLAEASVEELMEAIRPAGLQAQKAKTIRRVSEILLKKYRGDLGSILRKPLEVARKELISIPGIGPKTADVLLLFSLGRPTIPVDTHVMRVSRRIGLAPRRGNYEAVRRSLMEVFRPEDYLEAHLLLIKLGRTYCKSRKPKCTECPIKELCDSYKEKRF